MGISFFMSNIYITQKEMSEPIYEFVERKGLGPPDTLADALAEHLSVEYSKYTLKKFGAILHHNFDKVGLLGGASFVRFGEGKITKPIRVLINGRASTRFSDTVIPVKELLISWVKDFMLLKFPIINPDADLEFHYNLSNQSSPGKTNEKNSEKGTRKYWFEPRGLDDLQELKHLLSNDTSLGIGYAPYSRLEQLVLDIEEKLNSNEFQGTNPWIGSDIKIMAFRYNDIFDITLCIPQISLHVQSVSQYKNNLKNARGVIKNIAQRVGISNMGININTRDNFENSELYLTAIGSSIESGDEGLVGRGNRINGLISPMRPMSMEGACGKNPVYHIGKVYYIAANEISKKIYKEFEVANEVALISQSGRDLLDPWVICVTLPKNFSNIEMVQKMIKNEIKSIPQFTNLLLEQRIRLY
jgi:S-adenosylmethionine synthetase